MSMVSGHTLAHAEARTSRRKQPERRTWHLERRGHVASVMLVTRNHLSLKQVRHTSVVANGNV